MGWQLQTLKYDLMRDYRNTVPVEQQDQIWEEVRWYNHLILPPVGW